MTTLDQLKARYAKRRVRDLDLFKRIGHLPMRFGNYRLMKSVADALRGVTQVITRDCCKITTQRVALYLLRYHSSDRMLRDRREFYLDTRELALDADLALSRAEIMTALEKLVTIPYWSFVNTKTGERRSAYILERAPLPAGCKWQQATWGERWRKPILWRFTAEFRAFLDELQTRMRLFRKESKCTGPSRSFDFVEVKPNTDYYNKNKKTARPVHLDSFAKKSSESSKPPFRAISAQPISSRIEPPVEIVSRPVLGSILQRPLVRRLADLIRGASSRALPEPTDVRANGALDALPDYARPDNCEAGDPRLAMALAKRRVDAPTIAGARLAADQPAAKREMREGERTFGKNGRVTSSERATTHG